MARVLGLIVTALLVLSAAADWQQVYPSGYQPAARKFHSAVVQGSDVLFFGGTNGASSFNDIFSWNIETNVITQFNPSGALPKERHLHTAVFSSSGEMTVFAGHLYAGVEFASDMWMWHNSSQTWSEVQYANSPPPPRAAHSAATVGDLMYVYGGTGPNATDSDAPNITYNDLWTFNFSTLMWTQISTAIDIGPRTGIVSGAHGHDLYLYGGQDGLSNAYGDFWKLDTTSNSWDLVFEYPNPSFNSFLSLTSALDQAQVAGDSYYMFGGTNTDESNADLSEFTINNSSWQQVGASSAVQPFAVSGSAGGLVGNQFSVFGGANLPGGSVIADYFVYTGV